MDKITSTQTQPAAHWHLLTIPDALEKLHSRFDGLSTEEAHLRITQFGPNELRGKQATSPVMLFIKQFTSLLIIILFIAGIVSAVIGEGVEAIAIIIIVILAGVLGFLQEYRAGKAIESLQKMAAPYASALRDGKEVSIPAREIVPGDIVLLRTGDKIPADARLLEVMNLKIDEASLTGESESVEKTTSLSSGDTSLGDRLNMAYMGTAVSYGRGKALVTSTGMFTEFGKIADLLQATESRKTPLQVDLDKVGKVLGIFSILIAALISVFGMFSGYAIVDMFIWGIALAVAVIPEALPAVVTISLALGVRRMVKRRALIRKLAAVETLGATTIICSDKTGTLTQDEMTVRKIFTNGRILEVSGAGYKPKGTFSIDGVEFDHAQDRDLTELFYAGVLCSDTVLHLNGDEWEVLGDPTEGGVIVAAMKADILRDEMMNQYPRVNEIPFTSERKRMTTIHQHNKGYYAFSKGAPEVILGTCSFVSRNGKPVPLTDAERKDIVDHGHRMGEDALRVLGFAEKILEPDETIDARVEHDMVFLGLMGMIDPPRPEVKQAIKLCEQSGIKPVMITGDHKITAVAVARELGILNNGGVITGTELEHLSDEDLEKRVESINVYARIAPVHKMRIVTAFMNLGHVVAMTGDGVNDAPSLKKADIGVAMGITGTDVSKEAADMILTDDNFASIVAAIEEGRSIFENIRKYLIFLLSGNMATVFAMIGALVFILPLPLDAVQILFINFIMDGLIAIALGVEPPEPGIMRRKPRDVHEGILHKRVLWRIGGIGVWIALVTMSTFVWELSNGYSTPHAVTVFFATLILSRLFNGMNCRSMDDSIFKLGFFTNKPLVYSTIIALFCTFAVIYFPPLQKPFGTVFLSTREVFIAFFASSTVLIMAEIQKTIRRKMFPLTS
ncbi:MAG: calcium-transporting P-type ATPase, PMR1-type [Ignavibacteriae bacterium]|nr:MAG: calcium-transporting P-type ATPase, PMR1-type [Ignavibacteriota bacterium]